MNATAFAKWLTGIGRLDGPQRDRVVRELALAAADAIAGPDHALDDPGPRGEVATAPAGTAANTIGATPAADLLSKVGRVRIASFGCPHCGRDEVRPWGTAGGKPRYRCIVCRKTFNPLTGTPLAGLHHRDCWPDQAQALIEPSRVCRRLFGLTQAAIASSFSCS